jgi:hypothetical protein
MKKAATYPVGNSLQDAANSLLVSINSLYCAIERFLLFFDNRWIAARHVVHGPYPFRMDHSNLLIGRRLQSFLKIVREISGSQLKISITRSGIGGFLQLLATTLSSAPRLKNRLDFCRKGRIAMGAGRWTWPPGKTLRARLAMCGALGRASVNSDAVNT